MRRKSTSQELKAILSSVVKDLKVKVIPNDFNVIFQWFISKSPIIVELHQL